MNYYRKEAVLLHLEAAKKNYDEKRRFEKDCSWSIGDAIYLLGSIIETLRKNTDEKISENDLEYIDDILMENGVSIYWRFNLEDKNGSLYFR